MKITSDRSPSIKVMERYRGNRKEVSSQSHVCSYNGYDNDYWFIINKLTLDLNQDSREYYLPLLYVLLRFTIWYATCLSLFAYRIKKLMVRNVFMTIVALAHNHQRNEFNSSHEPQDRQSHTTHVKIR